MSPELLQAVKERVIHGYTKEQIAAELSVAGYTEEQIKEINRAVLQVASPTSVSQPEQSVCAVVEKNVVPGADKFSVYIHQYWLAAAVVFLGLVIVVGLIVFLPLLNDMQKFGDEEGLTPEIEPEAYIEDEWEEDKGEVDELGEVITRLHKDVPLSAEWYYADKGTYFGVCEELESVLKNGVIDCNDTAGSWAISVYQEGVTTMPLCSDSDSVRQGILYGFGTVLPGATNCTDTEILSSAGNDPNKANIYVETENNVTGSLKVTIIPEEAVAAGAKWRIYGEEKWRDPGVHTDLPLGEFNIEFNTTKEWLGGGQYAVLVKKDKMIEKSVEYYPIFNAHLSGNFAQGTAFTHPISVMTYEEKYYANPEKFTWKYELIKKPEGLEVVTASEFGYTGADEKSFLLYTPPDGSYESELEFVLRITETTENISMDIPGKFNLVEARVIVEGVLGSSGGTIEDPVTGASIIVPADAVATNMLFKMIEIRNPDSEDGLPIQYYVETEPYDAELKLPITFKPPGM